MLGRRPDGYHDIETLFLALPWGDGVEVMLEDEPGVRLDVRGDPSVPGGGQNLAVKAAHAYLAAARGVDHPVDEGVRIVLEKVIPSGAGLGGGSADAAVVLRRLEEETSRLGRGSLACLAASLGADVPFLLEGGAAVGRGCGECLEQLADPPPLEIVLILPGTAHETARVYAHARTDAMCPPPGGIRAAVEALASGEPRRIRAAHYNALAVPAGATYPGFSDLASEVERRLGRPPAVTGTGSTLYDVPEVGEGEDVLRRLEGLPARVLRLVP